MGNGVNWSDMWNSWGKFGFGGGGMGMPFGGGFGGMGCTFGDGFNYGNVGDSWGGSSSSSSSSSKLTDEEKKAKRLENRKLDREFQTLKDLLMSLTKDESILTYTERDDLQDDLTHLSGKNKEEKFESLKALYNKYKDTIKNNLGKLGEMSKDFAGIGYEVNSELTDAMPKLSSAITNESEQGLAGFQNVESIKTLGVLNILSTWNSSSSANGKTLMKTILDKYDAIDPSAAEGSTGTAKRADLENFAKNLKSELSSKADNLANNANLQDDALKQKLKDMKSSLDASDWECCADVFDSLYEACRIAGAKIMESTYKEKYEFLGGDNLFGDVLAETIADLKAEAGGFDGEVDDVKAASEIPASEKVKKTKFKNVTFKSDATWEGSNSKLSKGDGGVRLWKKNEVPGENGNDSISSTSFQDLYNNGYNLELGTDAHEENWDIVKTRLVNVGNNIKDALAAQGLDEEKLGKAVSAVIGEWHFFVHTGKSAYDIGATHDWDKFTDPTSCTEIKNVTVVDDGKETSLGGSGCNEPGQRNNASSTYVRLSGRIEQADNKNGIFVAVDDSGNNQTVFMINFKAFVDAIMAKYDKL